MRKLRHFALLALLPLAALMLTSGDDATILLPNPGNCSTFFMCSNGVPILMQCPAGLYFDSRRDVCDWPQNTDCIPDPNLSEWTPTPGASNLCDDEFKYKMDKDPCVIEVTAEIIVKGKIADSMKKLGLGLPSVSIIVDLTHLTCLYSPGGNYRLGDDVRCADLY